MVGAIPQKLAMHGLLTCYILYVKLMNDLHTHAALQMLYSQLGCLVFEPSKLIKTYSKQLQLQLFDARTDKACTQTLHV